MGYMGATPTYLSVAQAQDIPCRMRSLQGSKVIHQSGAEALITEEPDVLIGLVRICGGPGGQPPGLPGTGSAGKGVRLPVIQALADKRKALIALPKCTQCDRV